MINPILEYLQKSASLGYVPAYFMIYALQFDKGNIEEGILNLRKAVICGISRDEFFTSLRDGLEKATSQKRNMHIHLEKIKHPAII